EGVNLQAARNLAGLGGYGLVYGDDDWRPFDLQLTTGPTVIAPVAAAFRLFGSGLREGRLVMLGYTLLAALGLFLLGRRLYGPSGGAAAVRALCAAGDASPASTRAVVGEIAALAFLFWGTLVYLRARATKSARDYVLAGCLLGLAVASKGQFGLVLPAIAGVYALLRRDHRNFALLLVSTLAASALWQLYQLLALGPAGYLSH